MRKEERETEVTSFCRDFVKWRKGHIRCCLDYFSGLSESGSGQAAFVVEGAAHATQVHTTTLNSQRSSADPAYQFGILLIGRGTSPSMDKDTLWVLHN